MSRIAQFVTTEKWSEDFLGGHGNILATDCGEYDWEKGAAFKSASSVAIIRKLTQQLSGKADENEELRERVDELAERLDKQEQLLKEILDPANLPVHGTFEQWRESDDEVNPYRGKHVAFVAGKGVIAFSDTLDGLMVDVEKKGKPDGLIIGFVPIASALVSKC